MIICVRGAKGGSGTSSLSACLAVAAAREGLNPIALDLDPQGSLSTWAAAREAQGIFDVEVAVANTASLPRLLASLQGRTVILDTPPHSPDTGRKAVTAADVIVVPTEQGGFDLAAIASAAELLRIVRRPVVTVLNRVQASVPTQRATYDFLAGLDMPVRAEVGLRVALRYAVSQGRGVHECQKPTHKSCLEIDNLWRAVKAAAISQES